MKKRIISVLLAVLMALSSLSIFASAFDLKEEIKTFDFDKTPGFIATSGSTFSYESIEAKLADMKLEISNDKYEMYVKEDTGEFILKDKRTGQLMTSTPHYIENSTEDTRKLYSMLNLTYVNRTTGSTSIYSSFEHAAAYGQVKVSVVNSNKVEVTYALGEIITDEKIILVPKRMSNSFFVDLQKQIVDNGGKLSSLKRMYESGNGAEIIDEEYNGQKIRILQDVVNEDGTTSEGIWQLGEAYADNMTQTSVTNAQTLFKSYTDLNKEKLLQEYEKLSYVDETIKEQGACFFVTMEYILNDEGFSVNLNIDRMKFDSEEYLISDIEVLPNFNPAIVGSDSGYALVPDGSGALVRYENNTSGTGYPLYGFDYAYTDMTNISKNQEQTIFPVFGSVVKTNGQNKSFFSIIENGDSIASIIFKSENMGSGSQSKSIYTKFKVCPVDNFKIESSLGEDETNSANVNVTIDEYYKGNLSVKYVLLPDETLAEQNNITDAYAPNYIDMARYYRNYLIKNDVLSKITNEQISEKTKIFLEVFGSIEVTEKILTFPVKVNKELTTFEDIITMYKQLDSSGVSNTSFILTGFANGGLASKYPTSLEWQKVLGGKKGYANLAKYARENNFDVALNLDFAYSQKLEGFSGFSYKKTAALTLEERYTTKREYDPSRQIFRRTGGVVISSGSYDLAYQKFMKDAKDFDILTIAPRTLGSDLNSDFDQKTGCIFREQSKVNTQNMLNKFKNEAGYNVILDKGNAYSLAYANGILNIPLESSNYTDQTESVPFVGMVLHGSIEYAGSPINMEGDQNYAFLKSLENGSVLYFTLAMQNIQLLKNDPIYNKYYSIDYEEWKTTIVSMYSEYNSLMSSKQTSYLVEHEFLNNKDGYGTIRIDGTASLDNSKVVRVEYENGEGFILNYNTYAIEVTYGGTTYTIEAMGYATYKN